MVIQTQTPTRVPFNDRVVLKEIAILTESWTAAIPLNGSSDPCSVFVQKRLEVKRHMAREHYWRIQRLMRENTKLSY